MAIEIEKKGNLFNAKIFSANGNEVEWYTGSPMSESALVDLLKSKYIDQREIQEAFLRAAPNYFGVGKW